MTAPFTWATVGTKMALLTTQLDALANGTLCAIGPQIDNTVAGGGPAAQLGQITVTLASAVFVAPSFINIYLVPSNDTAGTSYPNFTNATAAALANYLVATVYINGSTAAQVETYANVPIPLGKFKALALTGGSCPTLGATGNTVDLYPTPSQY